MAAPQEATYPRPDFERSPLRWESLNGPWDFLFDDDDRGLSANWHRMSLPDEVGVTTTAALDSVIPTNDSITRNIVGDTLSLIENNTFSTAARASNFKTTITVPFVFQAPASGINDRGVHEVLWYERAIADLRSDDEKRQGHRLLLRFGAVDYIATVWVNGEHVGGHRGGHVPFEIDVTDALAANPGGASHRLTVRVYDSAYDLTQPRGKQYWGAKPESIFYTPSGGIWQSVWLEVVPAARIADSSYGTVIKSNDIESGTLRSTVAVLGRRVGQSCSVEIEASFAGVPVGKSSKQALARESDAVLVELDLRLTEAQRSSLPQSVLQDAPLADDSCWRDGVALWSPEHPQLYDLVIRLLDESGKTLDEVKTTTGMRSINWTKGDGLWRLNDKPYFQALCLDQGYWPETFMTPPTADSLKVDIQLAKKMGFNGCRKHQKVEDPIFYYWADKLGYLVWGEMANAYQFSQEYVDRFNAEWTEAVKLVINRPSIVTWTPVNESWGYTSLKDNVDQRNHIRQLYYLTKSLDNTRSINDNCGWEHVITDLSTFHDYSDGPELEKTCASLEAILDKKADRLVFVAPIDGVDPGAKHQPGAPVMNTEFGGVNIAPAKQPETDDEKRDWGYTTATDPEDLLKRIERLVKGVTNGGHCCTFVYTQLADIEQEVNGVYTFDRQEKLDSTKVKAMINEAVQAFYDRVNKH
ncbi:family 2 glycoside hydrolase [Ilyonectria robusta]|uniref:family 2 glycoside hydrolase n=1 Tax=Ilyonectria robusta TaxID=1079257 RepID=UPI001E8E3045|nr:family 2 glycoside hydrolase [Ilyonectria robusta]KAH8688387.1 family 2 glycoside hydrolase [Ilyonectria robusta]